MTDIPEDAKPVGWFNPWNDYHGYQQVAKEYEGTEHVLPLYSREEVARLILAERSRQIERDAKIAEEEELDGFQDDDYDAGYYSAARGIAAAIRAQEPKA